MREGNIMNNTLSKLKEGFLSNFALKMIAIITMVIDHIGSIVMDGVIAPYKTNGFLYITNEMPLYVKYMPLIKNILSSIGDVAFPIFCFLITEGFIHTKSREKYMLRLGIFALISEIPFNYVHYEKIFNFDLQNVLFTLLIGVCTLYLIDLITKHSDKIISTAKTNQRKKEQICKIILIVMTVIFGMIISLLLRSEYVFLGILAMVLMYLLRNHKILRAIIGVLPLIIASPYVLFAIIPMLLYNGTRGRKVKYLFYIFYPAHLIILKIIAIVIESIVASNMI